MKLSWFLFLSSYPHTFVFSCLFCTDRSVVTSFHAKFPNPPSSILAGLLPDFTGFLCSAFHGCKESKWYSPPSLPGPTPGFRWGNPGWKGDVGNGCAPGKGEFIWVRLNGNIGIGEPNCGAPRPAGPNGDPKGICGPNVSLKPCGPNGIPGGMRLPTAWHPLGRLRPALR